MNLKNTAALIAFSMLMGCSSSESDLKERVKRTLIDPESVQFRELSMSVGGACLRGEVNAKNRMGGYVGFQKFYASEHTIIIANNISEEREVLSEFSECLPRKP